MGFRQSSLNSRLRVGFGDPTSLRAFSHVGDWGCSIVEESNSSVTELSNTLARAVRLARFWTKRKERRCGPLFIHYAQ